ncbi:acyltransferase [Sporomusa sp. KB1]|jgi:peptidoglycan/LPS O-acetylase OafA/YrhL|uniref:acyltransferase family protein n=1 Tax=Sporomusa sp. KB1 TaxID=943346 RepID=UPI0011A12A61|nr:acyltransferase [Sporomusa sp. KB1]TWH45270.1 DNA phosphorothioation-dependent restriction protein DptG [Sporomusa sp. KB1]
MKSNYLPQIDFLKAFAIIFVILMHTIRSENIPTSVYLFFIVQAVPVFLVIAGFNWCLSFKNKGLHTLSDAYTKAYFLKNINRLVMPFSIIYLCSLLLGISQYFYSGHTGFIFNVYSLIGLLPIPGPGNYFFTIMIELVFIFPVLYLCYLRKPKFFLLICFIVNIAFELISPYILSKYVYLYNASALRFLFAISLGMWISNDYHLSSKSNIPVLIGSIFSIIYLLINTFGYYAIPHFLPNQHTQNILSFFYPALLVLVGITCLPKTVSNNSLNKFIIKLGKASYHIFLVQMFYFSIICSSFGPGLFVYFAFGLDSATEFLLAFINLILNETICILIGLWFYNITSKSIIANIKGLSH